MTIIEFFEKAPLENIAGALLCNPDRVIFIGDKKKQMERSIAQYQRVLRSRGMEIPMSFKSVNKNQLANIVEVLESIVAKEEACVFDVTGGEDLYLVAVGMIMFKHRGRVQCHRLNFRNSTIQDCDTDGIVCAPKSFDLSVEENILIHGGEILPLSKENAVGTFPWHYDEEFCEDIESMWAICRSDPRLWNAHVGTLGALNDTFRFGDSLDVCFSKDEAAAILRNLGVKYTFIAGIMETLQEVGVIENLSLGEQISFTYKNEQIKKCLTVAGQILELAMAARLADLRDADGQFLYHDIRVGTVIDWDGAFSDEAVRTINEIDVLTMKDSIPIFISCKNGNFDVDELYKLNTVAERFGSGYAKKVLIATELDKIGYKAEYIRARANDMKIRLIEDVDRMDEEELERLLRSLWSN